MLRQPKAAAAAKLCPCCAKQAEFLYDVWGQLLCRECLDAWLVSPESKAVEGALYPFSLWELARATGKSPLPLDPHIAEAARRWVAPTSEQCETARRQALATWIDRRKPELKAANK